MIHINPKMEYLNNKSKFKKNIVYNEFMKLGPTCSVFRQQRNEP
jgi:hypothetical protein